MLAIEIHLDISYAKNLHRDCLSHGIRERCFRRKNKQTVYWTKILTNFSKFEPNSTNFCKNRESNLNKMSSNLLLSTLQIHQNKCKPNICHWYEYLVLQIAFCLHFESTLWCFNRFETLKTTLCYSVFHAFWFYISTFIH